MANNKRSKAKGPELPLASQPGQAAPPTLAELESIFAQALAFHRAGMLAEAEQLYRRVLDHRPGSFDCQHLLGVISHQRGNCLPPPPHTAPPPPTTPPAAHPHPTPP